VSEAPAPGEQDRRGERIGTVLVLLHVVAIVMIVIGIRCM